MPSKYISINLTKIIFYLVVLIVIGVFLFQWVNDNIFKMAAIIVGMALVARGLGK